MANLHYGIESGKGLVVVTGEVGTGKTTILRWMMQRLDRTVLVAYIFNPRLSVPEFYQHVSQLLDVQKWETKAELLLELGRALESRHSRSEEHTSELQSPCNLVCRLLLEKKKR